MRLAHRRVLVQRGVVDRCAQPEQPLGLRVAGRRLALADADELDLGDRFEQLPQAVRRERVDAVEPWVNDDTGSHVVAYSCHSPSTVWAGTGAPNTTRRYRNVAESPSASVQ